ncbi:PPE family protein [Mycobacterium saskatchewanense]|uniref:PPE domain-containing protein n=1 Tax=Mycobacterium saskatchewanense TaxID=220927 RepID=A0AAJ3NST2_9MYCO|nr:PPE family protein [Mycobacterium saskatchewanense]ORW74215.1 hypothetical protein AWC23_05375 [Mycobacterium saskatchewanense]BBX64151.1 PPE family protein [Mycobacterium saskatchewanense]
MLWHAMPPELNTARLMAGAGPGPMLQAAAGWEALGAALEAQAIELSAALVALKASWSGMGSERAIAAATPMVAWLQSAAQQARQRGLKASAQAAAYTKALAMTPSLPEIATNHITHAVLTATNFLGINLVPIGFNEMDYFVRMWTQAATVMDVYAAETMTNTVFEPVEPMKPIVQPGMGGQAVATEALGSFSSLVSDAAPAALRALSDAAEGLGDLPVADPAAAVPLTPALSGQEISQLVAQMGQFGAPMQQLMQPLQQITSLASQTGGMGGPGNGLPGDGLGAAADKDGPQLGLLGASPLSTHPLAGGSGPSVGMGLMHSEALPGAGGSSARTPMMSQLIDKPVAAAASSGSGAGSSAVGGSAPMGLMGAGAQSAAVSRHGLAAPALLAPHPDDGDHDELDDQDDW